MPACSGIFPGRVGGDRVWSTCRDGRSDIFDLFIKPPAAHHARSAAEWSGVRQSAPVVTIRRDVTTGDDVSGNQSGNRQGGQREPPTHSPSVLSAALADRQGNQCGRQSGNQSPLRQGLSRQEGTASSPRAVTFTVGEGAHNQTP